MPHTVLSREAEMSMGPWDAGTMMVKEHLIDGTYGFLREVQG